MAKYDPLRRYLTRQKDGSLELSFSAIEQMNGADLPKPEPARARTGRPTRRPRPGGGGFEAKLVRGGEKVVFQRA